MLGEKCGGVPLVLGVFVVLVSEVFVSTLLVRFGSIYCWVVCVLS